MLISRGWIWVAGFFFLIAPFAFAQAPSYSIALEPGFNSIANHFDRGSNKLDEVIPDPPDGAELWKFNPATQSYYSPATFIRGSWSFVEREMEFLRPGEGAFLRVDQKTVLTFTGSVAQFPMPGHPVFGGHNLVSAHEPRTMSFAELFGFPPASGDIVYLYEKPIAALPDPKQQNPWSTHKFIDHAWDSIPAFRVGRSAFVYLSEGPRIFQHPSSQIVDAGQTVRFDVSALGVGPLTYQWQFHEDDIPDETNSFLLISNVQYRHSGMFSVVVANRSGAVSSRFASLRVNSRPVILEQPEPVQTVPGGRVAFHVRATGTPKLRYQWFRDNQPEPNGTEASLVIERATQAGQYSVRVSNDLGFVQSQSVPLAVIVPPEIRLQPVSQTAGLGQAVSFAVEATGTPALRFQWRHNGQRIDGATNPVLTVSDILPRDAGTYDVVVWNAIGAAHSEPALLILDVPSIFLEDEREKALLFQEPVFTGFGHNMNASNEPGEVHCERKGGSSVWLSWMAPARGVVRFETSGSSFDTVLAAYVIDPTGKPVEIACDDDEEGEFFGSRIRFNAYPDTIYYIAIDGVDGARGRIIIDWRFDPADELLPVITQHPRHQTARTNDPVTFTVSAAGQPGLPLLYQWYHNGQEIGNQNEPQLRLPSIGEKDLGYYHAEVTQFGREIYVARSRRALLQISVAGVDNQLINGFAVDKVADALDRSSGQGPLNGGIQSLSEVTAFSPVLGYTGTQIFSTVGFTGEPGELSHCGIPGGSSAWFSFKPEADGQLFLDTAGSNFDTVLAVYTGPGPTIATFTNLICDNNSGPGTTSGLNFPASANTNYYIAVDGLNGVTGTAHLNYRLLIPISLTRIAKTNETTCRFRVKATPSYPFTIQRSQGFSTWVDLLTTNWPTQNYEYRDTNAIALKRFYRVVQTP